MTTTHSGVKRQRSPSPTGAAPPSARAVEEWALLHDRAVMALPPTAAMIAAAAAAAAACPPSTPRAKSEEGGDDGATMTVRVAAFDMDDTLVRYQRGRVADPEQWEWHNACVPGHLQQLAAHGYIIVLFSNQSGVRGGKGGGWNAVKAEHVQKKIVAVGRALGVPIAAYVSTGYDAWRKPLPGMWGQLQEDLVASAAVGVVGGQQLRLDCNTHSFYVGDAAGRVAGPGRPKKDFSCGDRRFAHNLSLPFYTPTQFFDNFPTSAALCAAAAAEEGEVGGGGLSRAFLEGLTARPEEPFEWGGVSPEQLRSFPSSYAGLQVSRITAAGVEPLQLPATAPFFVEGGAKAPQEVVVLVGPPSSGKSTFYRRHFLPYGYIHVNRDTLGTKERCLKAVGEHWAAGRRVVVDNTNPTKADRKMYVDLVRRLSKAADGAVPVRFIALDFSRELALHLNSMRARLGQSARIPEVAYHTFFARYEPITAAEVKTLGTCAALTVPPVITFDGLAPRTRREFFVLS